ncbi:hypothetical protein JJL56_17625 [Azospirillum sp. YIM DDC1]|uniref:Uncharacterized protein n=1 Tax=Azospirillum aestuarii TaxID=2802052 RepID=A0ABS1I138_9PROT|nr:hypothetical protein [Azospirillum aestuarii]MBK3772862.1 hypothetical protein [Azospirillum brasilense]MBK4720690.1 hypothetical protein [Azospirillum aestuarii]TWA88114.1 hypothetical protein FBY14_109165 [Azospirillum brasilense]
MSILPLSFRPFTPKGVPPRPDGRQEDGGWVAAVAIVALAMVVAIALLGVDWHRMLVRGEAVLPENQRSMVVTPMPR